MERREERTEGTLDEIIASTDNSLGEAGEHTLFNFPELYVAVIARVLVN